MTCKHCGSSDNLLTTATGRVSRVCRPCRREQIRRNNRSPVTFRRPVTHAKHGALAPVRRDTVAPVTLPRVKWLERPDP